ncbi:MAG: polyprenyl synthetase family protein, partial [Catalinimonas sp.]
IKDDLFDYGDARVGKPVGIDIKEKKMTLPLIHALRQAPRAERRRVVNLVRNHHDDPKRVAEVIAFVKEQGGLAYAQVAMQRYRDEAAQILATLPEGDGRTSLDQLVQFTIDRTR